MAKRRRNVANQTAIAVSTTRMVVKNAMIVVDNKPHFTLTRPLLSFCREASPDEADGKFFMQFHEKSIHNVVVNVDEWQRLRNSVDGGDERLLCRFRALLHFAHEHLFKWMQSRCTALIWLK